MLDTRRWLVEELGYDEAEEFSKWALGNDYSGTYLEDVPEKWNKLHGSIFQISEDGDMYKDLWRMIEAWGKRQE